MMSVNLEKVGVLTSFVDSLVQIRNLDNQLNEQVIEDLVKDAVSFGNTEFTDEELEAARRDITWKYQIYTTPGESILEDYDQTNWYDEVKSDIQPVYWTRYKNYLIDKKHFSPSVVSTLGDETLDQKLMNYILNPNTSYAQPTLRRGLVIGDVQSGKTSTYIGFICKAADAGYQVFILLTGTIESLRKQTQERVEEGFIGIDMSANTTGGKRVGVGEDNKPITAMALTSRKSDFTGNSDKIAVAMTNNNRAVVFVVKKQKDVLTKLKDWLVTLNADPSTGKIDMPMIMIDDEADNASINTSKNKEDPTTINKLIRELANVFTVSNYVGFTATPFANVFIDPETTEKMETQDLFPENFIVSLPTPSNYIGPNRIFSEDDEFHSQLMFINDAGREEEDGYSFYFKHPKDWEGDLPDSLTDAIYTFYLANAIRDLRGDRGQHRSMMINLSRFIKVQKYVKNVVENIHDAAYRAIKFNMSDSLEDSIRDPIIARIYNTWLKQYSNTEFSWAEIARVLFSSIEHIQIRVINSSRNSEKLEYPRNESLRVIAIGGLALSRGLTLEGLVTSYFFRNTCTYDVLMQMGRWFGYRKNYEDLFRIWTHKASASWYAEIAEATDQLKDDMSLMRDLGMKPRDFGIRVRNNSDELSITAYNKMRNATDEYEFTSYYGSIIETPYLFLNPEVHKANFRLTCQLISSLLDIGFTFERQNGTGKYIIKNIPKARITDLLRSLKISGYSSNFDPKQIAAFLESNQEECLDRFDLVFAEGKNTAEDKSFDVLGRKIRGNVRSGCVIDHERDRLSIGAKGRLGGPADGIAGISDRDGNTAEEIIERAKTAYRADYQKKYGIPFDEKKSYPSRTWFAYVEERNPLFIIYLIDARMAPDEQNQALQFERFYDAMGDTPVIGYGIGFPKNDNAAGLAGTKFKANKVYNWFDRDDVLAEGEED